MPTPDVNDAPDRPETPSEAAIREALRTKDYVRLVERLDALKGSYAALYLLDAIPIKSAASVTLATELQAALDKKRGR